MMPFLLLFVFWAGVAVLLVKDPYDLKKRASDYTGAGIKGVYRGLVRVRDRLRAGLYRDALIGEVTECLGYIRNIAILGRSQEVSAVELLSQLSALSDRMRPVFEETARYLSLNDRAGAEQCFCTGTGLEISRGLASLLCGWEDTSPSDIVGTVDAYLSVLREEKITAVKKRNEIISDLVFFPVVINCVIVLVDFMYISFFINQRVLIESLI